MTSLTQAEQTGPGCYRLSIQYDSDYGYHQDHLYVQQHSIATVIENLPAAMRTNLQSSLSPNSNGSKETWDYIKGKLFSNDAAAQTVRVSDEAFIRHPINNVTIEPRAGRFYPAGLFNSEKLLTSNPMTPLRIVDCMQGELLVDSSHPLSGYDVTLTFESLKPEDDSYRACDNNSSPGLPEKQLPDFLTGPGMQLRYANNKTDFFSDDPFQRTDNSVDSEFYSQPRLIDHLDESALMQLRSLYNELVPAGSVVLDMMSSTNSHIDDKLALKKLTGLGMNKDELEANLRLDEIIVHDINLQTRLPFDDASFDVVLCSLSIEYLTSPPEVFDEVARIIKPGGHFIISFSNRWFPTKAVKVWNNLHDFERIGLVTEYFIESASFGPINTYSLRGLPRPANDRHQLPLSDPIYAIWANRA